MREHEVTARQLGVWLLAAVSAPLSAASGAGWAAVLLAGLAMLPLARLGAQGWQSISGAMAIVESVWLSILAGVMLRSSALFWPASHSGWFVPVVLLALASLTVPSAAPRVGAVVGLCLAVLYVPVLVGGAAQIELRWLEPQAGNWTAMLLIALLIPSLWGLWRAESSGIGHILTASGVVGVLFAVLVQGILSPVLASRIPDAFYQMSRAMELGVLSRIEPVVAVASALGWYALGALLHASAVRLALRGGVRMHLARLGGAALSALVVITGVSVPAALAVALCVVLWVVTQLCGEKMKKSEKRC